MGLLEKVLNFAMKKYMAKHETQLINAINKVNNGGTIDDVDVIVRDYFYLLKSTYKGEAPKHIEIKEDDYFSILVDGKGYDFDELIPHRDQRNTGRKMEIEVLLSNNSLLPIVQERLNEIVKSNW